MALTDRLDDSIQAVKNQVQDADRQLNQAQANVDSLQASLATAKAEVQTWKALKAGLRDALTLLQAEQTQRDAGGSLAPDLFTDPSVTP